MLLRRSVRALTRTVMVTPFARRLCALLLVDSETPSACRTSQELPEGGCGYPEGADVGIIIGPVVRSAGLLRHAMCHPGKRVVVCTLGSPR